jgi:phosphatidylglycerophosphatase GEP4
MSCRPKGQNIFVHVPFSHVIAQPHDLLTCRQEHFSLLRQQYPGSRLLIVSNTAGSVSSPSSSDVALTLAKTLTANTGVQVLTHSVKKPGCGKEIMEYFRNTDEREGLRDIRENQIAIVGDRLLTDMCLANEMGSWGVWVKEGVVPYESKSVVSTIYSSFVSVIDAVSLVAFLGFV